MTRQENQTIKWYNYWWALKPIRGQTIKNITTGESGDIRGEWKDNGGTVHRVAKASPSNEMWVLI